MLGPIFARECLTVPRRSRHYLIRSAYLGVLWILGLTAWQATVGWTRSATLGDASRFGLLLFQIVTATQLLLLLSFAAISGATAVAYEKDRRTFILLLLTDLRDYEIVVGKLLGSLLQILLLLAGTAPLLALVMLLGGVSLAQLGEALLVLAATGLAAGSLGVLVALWRDRTFPALALTLLFLVTYLVLTTIPVFAWQDASGGTPEWVAWLNPFVALQNVWAAPAASVDAEQTATASLLVPPALGYAGAMLLIAVLLNAWGMFRLRVWNPSGEPIMQREAPDAEAERREEEARDREKAHAAPGEARAVWANPILWREICTRAYGRRPLLVKTAYFVVLALICWFALSSLTSSEPRSGFTWAFGLVPVAVLSLVLVAAQAVTAITSERDTGALDLLLVTDLTPQEFIYGKLFGILYNAKEYLLPPFVLAAIYAGYGMLATPPRAHPELLAWRNGESLACVVGIMVVLLIFALVLGVHVALRNSSSRQAIINTLGTVFFLSAGTLVCILLILINGGRFEYQWTSFIFFLAAGIGGLWWVLNAERPSGALTLASWLCPPAVFYVVVNLLVAKPGSQESADPLIPFVVLAGSFGFAVAAMLVPLVSEFDVALGRTSAEG